MQTNKLEHARLVRGIAKGAGIVFLATILARILGYAIRVLIAREYGPEGYGLVSTSIAILTTASMIALLGFPNALSRQISFYLNTDRKDKIKNLIVAAYAVSSVFSLTFAILIFVNSAWIAEAIFKNKMMVPFLNYFAAGLIFYVWIQLAATVFKAFKQMLYFSIIKDLARFALILIAVICAILLKIPTEKVGLFYFIAYCAVGVIGTAIIFFATRVRNFPFVWSGRDVSILFKFSVPLVLAGIASILLFRIDVLMIGYFLNQTQVGIYDAAVRIAELLGLVLSSFSPFLLPAVTEAFAHKHAGQMKSMYAISTKWIFVLTVPLFSLMFFFPGLFLKILFGNKFLSAIPVLQIIALGFIVSASVGATGSILIAIGKTNIFMVNNFIVLCVNVVLNYFLIPRYGILGGGIASAISLVVLNAAMVAEVFHFTKIHPFSWIFLRIGVFAFGAAWLLETIVHTKSLMFGFLLFLLYGVIYVLGLVFTKSFDENDAIIFREFKKRLG